MQNANSNNIRNGKKKAAARTNPDLFSQTTVSSGASIGNVSLGTMGSYHEFAVCIKVYSHISTYFFSFVFCFFELFFMVGGGGGYWNQCPSVHVFSFVQTISPEPLSCFQPNLV